MKDTAYTAEALDAHTDTTYFSDPIGYQMFHLLSHTDGSGGESLLVDGMRCARTLFKEDPEAFKVLCETKINHHSSGNEGISISPAGYQPVLSANVGRLSNGFPFFKFRGVRWNRYDRASFHGDFKTKKFWYPDSEYRRTTVSGTERWYEAARKWSEIVKRPENEYWEQLKPGRPLSKLTFLSTKALSGILNYQVFDNRRVLHGRSAFTGNRRICGGYRKFCQSIDIGSSELTFWL